MRTLCISVLSAATILSGCGKSPAGAGGLSGSANFFNGATTASRTGAAGKRATNRLRSSTTWYLAPDKMTMTVTNLTFVGTSNSSVDLTNCSVTYDRSQASLVKLSACPITVAAGTYTGVQITWNTTFQMLIDDSTNGIYTDGSNQYHLNTTGGAQTIPVTDTNSMGQSTNTAAILFPSSKTYDSSNLPDISVVFDPTHWMIADSNGSSFTSFRMDGSPPIIVSPDGMGKAMIFNNAVALGSGNVSTGSFSETKIFYSTTTSPWTVITRPDPCGSHLFSTWAGSTIGVNCSGGGGCFGQGGFLGVDPSNVLSWAFPAGSTWDYSTWSTVLSLPLPTTPVAGSSTAILSYVCLKGTTTAPVPAGGAATYTTAPNLASYGNGSVQTMPLTLWAD